MKTYGLIGFPLGHSFSKKYFTEKFRSENILDTQYENFELVQISDISSLLQKNPSIKGLNVTIPYKESIIPFLDELTPDAREIGAVNCIQFKENKRIGHNTDWVGFQEILLPNLKKHHSKALILGTGGSSKAVEFVFKKLDIDYQFVSRNKQQDKTLEYSELTPEILHEHTILVNTTPIGMFPNTSESPHIPYHLITKNHLCIDLIYNPAETLFLKQCSSQKAKALNGSKMLVAQAEKSWEIWNH